MSDEQKENRVNIENLPQAEREVSPEEAQGVQGGTDYNTWRTNFGRTASAENEPENQLKQ